MAPPDWPPPPDTRILKTAAIAGGFKPLAVQDLMALWWLLRPGRLALFDLRIYLAGVEQHHRLTQGTAARERPHFYMMDLAERAGLGWMLNHRQERRLEASLTRLAAVGLLSWAQDGIDVAEASAALPQADRTPFAEWLRASDIKNGRRPVPVPRRMLRHIAAGNVRRTTFATALGVMVRCLHFDRRKELPCRSGGRCSVAWIAATFKVNEASVKRALDGLTRLGWLARLSQPSRKQQLHGAVTVINPWWKPNNLVDQEDEAIDTDGSVDVEAVDNRLGNGRRLSPASRGGSDDVRPEDVVIDLDAIDLDATCVASGVAVADQDVAGGVAVTDSIRPEDVVIDLDEIDLVQEVTDLDRVHSQTLATPGDAGPTCASPDHSGCSNGQRDEQEVDGFSEAAGGAQVGQGQGPAAPDSRSGEGDEAEVSDLDLVEVVPEVPVDTENTKLRPQTAKNDTKLRPRPTPNCAPLLRSYNDPLSTMTSKEYYDPATRPDLPGVGHGEGSDEEGKTEAMSEQGNLDLSQKGAGATRPAPDNRPPPDEDAAQPAAALEGHDCRTAGYPPVDGGCEWCRVTLPAQMALERRRLELAGVE